MATLMRLNDNIGSSLGGVFSYSGLIPILPTEADYDMTDCGDFVEAPKPTGQQAEVIKNTPLFVYHGMKDMTVPWLLSHYTLKMIKPLYDGTDNMTVDAEYDMAHIITETEKTKTAEWAQSIVNKQQAKKSQTATFLTK